VGEVFLFGIMVLTVCDVVSRYCFNYPIMGTIELVELMLAIMVFLGLAYATQKGHIVVEVIFILLPVKARAIVAFITSLMGLGFFIAVLFSMIIIAKEQIANNNLSGVLKMPIYPVTIAIVLAVAVMWLVLLVEFLGGLIKGGKE
jgi:TRAP-type C4-dicarboxylate transport system permease small subunit